MEDVTYDDKAEQFERLWDGMTPKGINRTKALKFRQYILEHVRQTKRPLTRENARKYWMGQLQQEINSVERSPRNLRSRRRNDHACDYQRRFWD